MLRPEWVKVEDVIAQSGSAPTTSPRVRSSSTTVSAPTPAGALHVSFAPDGRLAGNRPNQRRDAVIIVGLDHYVPGTYDPESFDRDGAVPMTPFTAEEIAALRELIVAAGLPIIDQWNGAGLLSGSFAVSDASIAPSLSDAVEKYLASCPEHGHPFCGDRAFNENEQACTWYSGSRALLVEPAFPHVPYPAPPGPPPPADDDRNLEAVRRALRAITPVLVEMGIHPATVVAGRRGHIDERDDGTLEFVPDAGHGVLIPAETAERLVAAAWTAVEAELEPHHRGDPHA